MTIIYERVRFLPILAGVLLAAALLTVGIGLEGCADALKHREVAARNSALSLGCARHSDWAFNASIRAYEATGFLCKVSGFMLQIVVPLGCVARGVWLGIGQPRRDAFKRLVNAEF